MAIPAAKIPGGTARKTGAHEVKFLVSSVSHFWLNDLVRIDSTWNPRSWSARLFSQELSNPAAAIKGLFFEDNLVGYLIAHVVMDEAHIVSLGIAPEFRGRGGGRFLLGAYLSSAQREGIKIVTLDVRVSNSVAQGLYHSIGFEAAGVRRHYYSDNGEDALTMRIALPSGLRVAPPHKQARSNSRSLDSKVFQQSSEA
jgi:ribosomal-protein-alanine N-acetyltransferase